MSCAALLILGYFCVTLGRGAEFLKPRIPSIKNAFLKITVLYLHAEARELVKHNCPLLSYVNYF